MLARHRRRLSRDHAANRLRKRSLRTHWDADSGMLHIWGHIPDADGALVRKTLDAIASDAPRRKDGGFVESHERRSADALVTLCGMSAAPTGRASVTVYADAAVLSADAGTATVEGGIPIAPETLRRLTCDGRVRTAVTRGGKTIGVGRMRRTVPSWLHDELMRRDERCRWDGCTSTRWLHAHHIEHWAHGGRTDADNLVMLCTYHHREVHEGGAQIQMTPDGRVSCVSRAGRELARAP